MTKEFVPYDLALKLKKLGFDEPCLRYIYTGDTGNNVNRPCTVLPSNAKNFNEDDLCVSAPTFQQAFRWFREKGYRYTISTDCFEVKDAYYFDVWKHQQFYFESGFEYESYEEAELACLERLIEIVQTKQEEQ